MATSIALAARNVVDRHLLGTFRGEPEMEHLERWVRDGFRYAITIVPPVQSVTVSATDGTGVPLPDPADTQALVYYVSVGAKVLFQTEWGQHGATITAAPAVMANGTDVTIWYSPTYEIEDTDDEVDTSCHFGADWLEEVAIAHAAFQAMLRLSQRSGTRGGNRYASMSRVLKQERDDLLQRCSDAWQRWDLRMRVAQNERRESGDVPINNSRRVNLANRSRQQNSLIP